MNQQQPGPPDEAALAFILVLVVFVLVALAIGLLIQYFFARTVSRCLHKVHPDNREVEPGQAYMIMIPLFNLYWAFRLAAGTADSVANEYHDRRWRANGDFGREIGKWWAICQVCGCVPILNYVAGPANLVLFVIYWVKVAELSRELDSDDGPDAGYGRKRKQRDDEYDDDDREDRR